jgi:DNA-binding CsgD family transcriptional regulator
MRHDVRSGSAMFACDRLQRIVAWNDAAERLVGLPRAEAVGKFCWEVVRATDPHGSLVCGTHCSRSRLGAHGWPVEPQELDVVSDHGRRRLAVDTLTVQDEDARTVVHVLHPAAGESDGALRRPAPHLTPRQLDVLRLLAEGRPAKEIARQLWLSEATVRNHIRAVLRELESHSQLEALSKARRLGLVA